MGAERSAVAPYGPSGQVATGGSRGRGPEYPSPNVTAESHP